MPAAVDSIKHPRKQGFRRAEARRNEPEREQEFLARDPRLQASILLQKELTTTLGGGLTAASAIDREAAKRLSEIIDPYGYSLEDALHLVQLHGADTESLSTAISQLVDEHLQRGFICEWKSTNRRVKERKPQHSSSDFRGGRSRTRAQLSAPRSEGGRRARPQGQENLAVLQPVTVDVEQIVTPAPSPTPTPTPVEKDVGEITTASSTESRGKASTWATLLKNAPSGGSRSKSLTNAERSAPSDPLETHALDVGTLAEVPSAHPPPPNNLLSSPASTLEEPAPPEPLPEAKMLEEAAESTMLLPENRNKSVPLPHKPMLVKAHLKCEQALPDSDEQSAAAVDCPPPPSAVVIPPSATAFHHKTLDLGAKNPSVTLPPYIGAEEATPNHVSYIFGSLRWDGEKSTHYEPMPVASQKVRQSEGVAAPYRVDVEDHQRSSFRSSELVAGAPIYPSALNQPQAQSAYAPMWQSSASADYGCSTESLAYGAPSARQDFGSTGPRRHQHQQQHQHQQPPTRQPNETQTNRDNSSFFLNGANRPLSIMGAYGSALTRSVIPPPYSMNDTSHGFGERQKSDAVRTGLMTHTYDPHQTQHLATSATSRTTAQSVYPGNTNAMYMSCLYPTYGNGASDETSNRNNARAYTNYTPSGANMTMSGFQQGGHPGSMSYASTYANNQYETQSPGEAAATATDRYMTDSRILQGQSWANTRDNDFVQAQAKRVMLSSYNHGAFDLAGADHLLQQASPIRMDVAPSQAAPQSSFPSLSNPSTLPSSYPRTYATFALPPGLPNYTYDRRY